MKFCYIDTETTGFDSRQCGLLQLAGCIEQDGHILEKFNYKMRPSKQCVWDPSASQVTGYTEQYVKENFQDPKQCFADFMALLCKYGDPGAHRGEEKMMPVGYNVSFDTDFVIQWFKDMADSETARKYSNGYFGLFYMPGFDVMQLANYRFLNHRQQFQRFNLEATCLAAGLSFNSSDAHDAFYDIKKTRELFHTLTNRKYYKKEAVDEEG